jgi:hypothetical protein
MEGQPEPKGAPGPPALAHRMLERGHAGCVSGIVRHLSAP